MDCLAALLSEPVNTTNIVISTKDFGTFHGISISYASIPSSFVTYGKSDTYLLRHSLVHSLIHSLIHKVIHWIKICLGRLMTIVT